VQKKTDDDDHNSVLDDIENDPLPNAGVERAPEENRLQEESTTGKPTKTKKKTKTVDDAKVKRSNHACGVCSSVFSSKNKLHQHLKDLNHAVLKTVVVNERKCKKKGK